MSTGILEILPLEVIFYIVETLAENDEAPHLANLNALAQTNRTFYEHANRLLYDYLAQDALNWALVNNAVNTAQMAINAGASPDTSYRLSTSDNYKFIDLIQCFDEEGIGRSDDEIDRIQQASRSPLPSLCLAAYYGSTEVVQLLLDSGAKQDSDAQFSEYIFRRPLCLAAISGHADTVRVLLDNSPCDLNATDDHDISVLHYAVQNCQVDVVKILLAADGIKFTESEFLGQTPFGLACEEGDVDMIEIFLSYRQLMSQYDMEYGLIYGICGNGRANDLTRVPLLESLLKHENVRMEAKLSALHQASGNGCIRLVQCLLKYGNLDTHFQQDDNDEGPEWTLITPVYAAASHHCPSMTNAYRIVRMLLDYGFSPNDKPLEEASPAITGAISLGYIPLIELLLDRGADIHFKSTDGWTILHHLAAGRKFMPDILERLLRGGVDILAANDDGCTPLGAASKTGKIDMIDRLLVAGADIQQGGTGPRDHTVLFEALCANTYSRDRDYDALVAYLLERGAPTTAVTDQKGPLHTACEEGRVKIAAMLLDHGADMEHQDDKGLTPLQVACANTRVDCARLLLEHGASLDVSHPRLEGQSVNSAAMWVPTGRERARETMALLREYGVE